ncbi:MAG: hypothetical protein ABJG47_11825 [Ekhidna sp.]
MEKVKSLSKLKKGVLIGVFSSVFMLGFTVNAEAKFWGKETVRIPNEFGYVECVDTYRFWIRWKSDCN